MFKNGNGQVRSGWVLILAVIVYLIGQSVFMFPGLLAWMAMEKGEILGLSESEILTKIEAFPWISLLTNGGGVIGAIIVTWLLWKLIFKRKLRDMGFHRSRGDFLFGLFLGAISITIIFLVLFVSKQITLENGMMHPIFSMYTLTYLLLFILVGFSEEMFFRGLIVSTLRSRGNSTVVVYVVSALIFGLAHGANPNASLLGIINIFLVGLLFIYMYVVTERLWLPIGYHITWNYFQGNVFGFPVSGTNPHGIYHVTVDDNTSFLTGGSFGLEGGLMATILIIVGFIATRWYASRRKHA
ncbi:CPBP family intramembrane glutamic endopeptidase [Virgibacillus halophilus]|uniref:Type II CAAX endopeptidase family protein n=1 Tax=Tigheibacillus halophilus TaxID=361280 RepID=A0ABU5C851_9BACI|nr:type II CAAX endopeptidase family protein [Virgibacillus halophilus]